MFNVKIYYRSGDRKEFKNCRTMCLTRDGIRMFIPQEDDMHLEVKDLDHDQISDIHISYVD